MNGQPRRLGELQAWLLEAVCGEAVLPTAGIVIDGPRLSGAERLALYRHAYHARLRECLRDDYPVLAAALGEARFEAVCDAYLALHPSSSPSLNAFGRHMSAVCSTTHALEAPAFYAELAALEWALVEVTHAETPQPLELAALQRIPAEGWAGARLIASQAVRLLRFEYPVNAFYQAFRDGGVLRPALAVGPSAVAVYRREIALWRMDLSPAMARVLGALLEGQAIANALGRISESEAHTDGGLMDWFCRWVEGGLFTAVLREGKNDGDEDARS